MFQVKRICCGYSKKTVLEDITFELEKGEILCILGPNGVGKTTFLKSVLGMLKLRSGEIYLNNSNLNLFSEKQRARVIAYVPQMHAPPFPYKVIDVVVMGTNVKLGHFRSPGKKEYAFAEDILESLGIKYLKDEVYTEISGGERQLVLIARALAQEPKILIMDEPTSNLDYGNMIKVLRQINSLADLGMSIIMTSHSPEQSFLCSAKTVLIEKNNTIRIGSPEEIVTEENMKNAYGATVRIRELEMENGNKVRTCIPML